MHDWNNYISPKKSLKSSLYKKKKNLQIIEFKEAFTEKGNENIYIKQ